MKTSQFKFTFLATALLVGSGAMAQDMNFLCDQFRFRTWC